MPAAGGKRSAITTTLRERGGFVDLGLNGKTALVAASSKGLGKACAMAFAREGAKVVICARDGQELTAAEAEIRKTYNAEVLAVNCDLTEVNTAGKLVAAAAETFGNVDILVNNSGGPPPGFFPDMQDEDWEQAFNLTVLSSVRLTRAVLPLMKKRRYGRIINITSVSVKQPIDQLLLSNSLRLAVVGWAKTLSNQVAAQGITINNVCPGWTRTGRVEQLLKSQAVHKNISMAEAEKAITDGIPMSRLGSPEEFADVVAFLASERAGYMTGATIQIDGGMTAGYF